MNDILIGRNDSAAVELDRRIGMHNLAAHLALAFAQCWLQHAAAAAQIVLLITAKPMSP